MPAWELDETSYKGSKRNKKQGSKKFRHFIDSKFGFNVKLETNEVKKNGLRTSQNIRIAEVKP